MRSRSCLVALLAFVAGCGLPYWEGVVPPVVARHDPCGTGALTREGARALHQIPFLQSVTEDSAIVAWAGSPAHPASVVVARADDPARTPVTAVPGRSVGPDPDGAITRFHEAYDDSDLGGEADVDEGAEERVAAEDFYRLAARVVDLPHEPAGYCYRLETDDRPLTAWASLTLAAPADPDRVDRFVLLGDTGTGQAAQRAIAIRIMNAPMDAILFLGDIAYKSGTHHQLQTRFFDIYASLFQRVPVYAAIGNHDNRTQRGRPFEEAFVLPGNERWYSVDLGDVHFVVLDTTRIGREQARWLEADLAQTKQQFIVVLGHHPPYSAGRRGGNRGFRRWFVPILERHPVELVLTGHEHHYERTKPIAGTVYIVSGGGGAHLTRAGRDAVTQVSAATHHYLTLEAHRDTLVVRAIDIDGNLLDQVTIADR